MTTLSAGQTLGLGLSDRSSKAASRVPWLISGLIAFEIFMVVIYLASVTFSDSRFFIDTGRFWDLDEEANLPAWFSSTQIWAIAMMFGVLAWREFNRKSIASWSLVAATLLFAFLSADEGAMVHERVGVAVDRLLIHRENSIFTKTGLWMVVLGPIFLAICLLLARGAWTYLRRDIRASIVGAIGIGIFLGSAVGIEMLSNFVEPGTTASYVQIAAEEFGEMLGMTITLWATCMLLNTLGIRLAPRETDNAETSF